MILKTITKENFKSILEIKYKDYKRKFINNEVLFNEDKTKIKKKLNLTKGLTQIKYIIKYNLFDDIENKKTIDITKYIKFLDTIKQINKNEINFNYKGKDRIFLFLLNLVK